MKNIRILITIPLFLVSSCSYLDVVPDNVATIDNAFTMRNTAEKYLFTCYSYLPKTGNYIYDPAVLGADEMWSLRTEWGALSIVRGFQNVVNPFFNLWSGVGGEPLLFKGIRDCNIFIDNINKVEELEELERRRWIAEAKFLKAYYHFYMLRMYGPIPLIKENLSISASVEEVKVYREPVEDCMTYILQLLDEAAVDLPDRIEAEDTELGRITKVICLAVKAQVLTLNASPLFNGNPDYASFTDNRGAQLFTTTYDAEKWLLAAEALKEAIDLAHVAGNKLYYYRENDPNGAMVSERTNLKMNIRGAVTDKWNPEVIWGNSNDLAGDNQLQAQARLDGNTPGYGVGTSLGPTIKMAEFFYSKNGVPIEEDKNWNYNNRFELRTATTADIHYIQEGYETVELHFEREPRFYGSLAFDGAIWYGQGRKSETNNWYVQAKFGQYSGGKPTNGYSPTGYWAKKLVNEDNVYSATNSYTIVPYPSPIIRLADLYLMYAEVLNEYYGPTDEVYHYLDLVRARAGLTAVKEAWQKYSIQPEKPNTQEGLRTIIHQERGIELALEGVRLWDLRRWKEAINELNGPVQGWNLVEESANEYYVPTLLHAREYQLKDYFWPIRELDLITNKNLVQNPGW
ncbi:starch-binding protein [Parapedobacter pyrenivorans]|uniref:Starch-binding protein n=1 Tax=Parapedobacter pyrenivorans TaxID=1305674 RepID=A0A917MFS5_9SPHI|nr:RagB/SusD family nutrient uptake outer membrane protein [Parapedobacter pyrenivorans]GGH03855.1 starch-binding protein [Parapedobacter pyrenivorans]